MEKPSLRKMCEEENQNTALKLSYKRPTSSHSNQSTRKKQYNLNIDCSLREDRLLNNNVVFLNYVSLGNTILINSARRGQQYLQQTLSYFTRIIAITRRQSNKNQSLHRMSSIVYEKQMKLQLKRIFFVKLAENYYAKVRKHLKTSEETSFDNSLFGENDQEDSLNKIQEDSLERIKKLPIKKIGDDIPKLLPKELSSLSPKIAQKTIQLSGEIRHKFHNTYRIVLENEEIQSQILSCEEVIEELWRVEKIKNSEKHMNNSDQLSDVNANQIIKSHQENFTESIKYIRQAEKQPLSQQQQAKKRNDLTEFLKANDYISAKRSITSLFQGSKQQAFPQEECAFFESIRALIEKYQQKTQSQSFVRLGKLQADRFKAELESTQNQLDKEYSVRELSSSLQLTDEQGNSSIIQPNGDHHRNLMSENQALMKELIVEKRKIFEVRKRLQDQIQSSQCKTAKIRYLQSTYEKKSERQKRIINDLEKSNNSPSFADTCSQVASKGQNLQIDNLRTQLEALKKENSLLRERNNQMKHEKSQQDQLSSLKDSKEHRLNTEFSNASESPIPNFNFQSLIKHKQIDLTMQKSIVVMHLEQRQYNSAQNQIKVLIQQANWQGSWVEDIKIYQQLSKIIDQIELSRVNSYREINLQSFPTKKQKESVSMLVSVSQEVNGDAKLCENYQRLKDYAKTIQQEKQQSEQRILELQAELVASYGTMEKMEEKINLIQKDKISITEQYHTDVNELQSQIIKMAKEVNSLTEKRIASQKQLDSKEIIRSLSNSSDTIKSSKQIVYQKTSQKDPEQSLFATDINPQPIEPNRYYSKQSAESLKFKIRILQLIQQIQKERKKQWTKSQWKVLAEKLTVSPKVEASTSVCFSKYISSEISNCESVQSTQQQTLDIVRIQFANIISNQISHYQALIEKIRDELKTQKTVSLQQINALNARVQQLSDIVQVLERQVAHGRIVQSQQRQKISQLEHNFESLIQKGDKLLQVQVETNKQLRLQIETVQRQMLRISIEMAQKYQKLTYQYNQTTQALKHIQQEYLEARKQWETQQNKFFSTHKQELESIVQQVDKLKYQHQHQIKNLHIETVKLEKKSQESYGNYRPVKEQQNQERSFLGQQSIRHSGQMQKIIKENKQLVQKINSIEHKNELKTRATVSGYNRVINQLQQEIEILKKYAPEQQSGIYSLINKPVLSLRQDKENRNNLMQMVFHDKNIPIDNITMLLQKELSSKKHENLYLMSTLYQQDKQIVQLKSQVTSLKNKIFTQDLKIQELQRKQLEVQQQNKYLKDTYTIYNLRNKTIPQKCRIQVLKLRGEKTAIESKSSKNASYEVLQSVSRQKSLISLKLKEENQELNRQNLQLRELVYDSNKGKSLLSSRIFIAGDEGSSLLRKESNKESLQRSQVFQFLNQQIHTLTQNNTKLQLKVVMLQSSVELNKFGENVSMFFQMLYKILGNFNRFLQSSNLQSSQNLYTQFLADSYVLIEKGEFQSLFFALETFLKEIIKHADHKYRYLQVSQQRSSIQNIAEKEANINRENVQNQLQNCRMILYQVRHLIKQFTDSKDQSYLIMANRLMEGIKV